MKIKQRRRAAGEFLSAQNACWGRHALRLHLSWSLLQRPVGNGQHVATCGLRWHTATGLCPTWSLQLCRLETIRGKMFICKKRVTDVINQPGVDKLANTIRNKKKLWTSPNRVLYWQCIAEHWIMESYQIIRYQGAQLTVQTRAVDGTKEDCWRYKGARLTVQSKHGTLCLIHIFSRKKWQ